MKKYYKRFIAPSILLIIALLIFGFSFLDLCGTCDWYNIFCHAGRALCLAQQGLFQMMMKFGAFILFVVSIILFVRAGLKK